MKHNEITDALIADGYSNTTPYRSSFTLVDGVGIDSDYANNEIKCPECGRKCHYEPWSQDGSYRAFAVCNTCDEAIEF